MKRRLTRWILGGLFTVAGVLHFVTPGFYLAIMPPWLPWHRALVYLSGAAEIAGGLGLFAPQPVRRAAGGGLVLLLLAVFPANVHMAREAIAAHGWIAPFSLATLVRLPLQFVLIAVAWWASGEKKSA